MNFEEGVTFSKIVSCKSHAPVTISLYMRVKIRGTISFEGHPSVCKKLSNPVVKMG